MAAKSSTMPGKKSIFVAYFMWLFTGIFGGHHFYLRRDRHAFVWWTTLGGFIVGWLGEIFRIPRYVREANDDPQYVEELARRVIQNKKPPFSMNRFTGMLMVGYSWAQMTMFAIPPDSFWGINLRYLNLLIPVALGLDKARRQVVKGNKDKAKTEISVCDMDDSKAKPEGVWTVGNIGNEEGSLKWPLLGAFAAYPIRYYVFDDSIWFTIMLLASACAFDSYSKRWRRTPKKKTHNVKRVSILATCACIYLSLWCSYLYFHGTITDSEGDEVPIYEALHHFFTSPWWLDVKQCIAETYQYAQHHGWYEVWKQIIDLSDPHGEQNAYRVLGVNRDSSQSEITSVWRKLSRENHPDKVKDEAERRAAQERFMEIQQAYEILSNSKHRRNRRNKKDNSDEINI
ncbi:dnaJ homolog subfamily C member 22 isoform X2 [Spodoptera litura]|uniref:DnaJ homolog subfamily C member 22 n=1 Tax=Spodoptera litura TaxID=69820 RepID=A0A9J7ELQ1_SPOLT|nr:dnaJ homolog subfamily C member 22 isoform X2 [Spodoptera litura]